MRTSAALFAALVAASTIFGCSQQPGATAAGLSGTSWQVVSIAGATTIPGAPPTMEFAADGTVSGTNGCNQYNGTYTTDGDKLTVGQLASTLMGCDVQRSAQEQAFNAALTGASTWSISATDELEIEGASTILAKPSAPAPDGSGGAGATELPGTSWVIKNLPGTQIGTAVPTIAFGTDGTVSGSAGCNTFNGSYTADGSSISFGPLATTKMACPQVDTAVETVFLEGLAGATSWSIDGQVLTLDGATTLTFAPA